VEEGLPECISWILSIGGLGLLPLGFNSSIVALALSSGTVQFYLLYLAWCKPQIRKDLLI
jgi:hypothetical protein